jgi:transcriptional antiterminator RfaH
VIGEILQVFYSSEGPPPLPWVIIQSQTCSLEDSKNPVSRRLRRDGFEPYNPRCLTRREKKPLQLFPGYMFVSKVDERWSLLRRTEGVHSLLMSAPEKPSQVEDHFVDGLKSLEGPEGVITMLPKFSPRQKVRITTGAFLDRIGLYEGQRQRDRVSVLLRLLGGKMRVFVQEDNLVAT